MTGIRQGQNIDYSRLGRSALPVPPADERAAIVRYLDYMDRRIRRYIRAKQKLVAVLEERSQVIVHQTLTRGLDPSVPLKSAGIEWLESMPQHWDVISLGAASLMIQTGPFGSQLHAEEYVAGGIPVVNPSHMRDGLISADPEVAVSAERARDLARHRLELGDVVAARRGELGRCALVVEGQQGWLCGTGSLLIRPRHELFEPAYLVQILGSSGVREMLTSSSVGATMDNLNTSMMSRLRLPVPPLSEQHSIMRRVADETRLLQAASTNAAREMLLLRELAVRLVADVVTGRLDVREAAAGLPDEAEEPESLADEILPTGESEVDEMVEETGALEEVEA